MSFYSFHTYEIGMMHHLFDDYFWQNGKPRGRTRLSSEEFADAEKAYKIITDPYHKRYSVERYRLGVFDLVLYDSALLDFRHLKPQNQQAWSSEKQQDNNKFTTCLVRDQNDRIVYIEEHIFLEGLCRECRVYSPQRQLLSIHKMFYTKFRDPDNGVVLYDLNDRPVLVKLYECDESGVFTNLVQELRDMNQAVSSLLHALPTTT